MWTNAMAMENSVNFPRDKNTKKLDLTSLLYVFVDSWRSRVACLLLQIIIITYHFVRFKEFQPVCLYLSYTYSSLLPGYEESTYIIARIFFIADLSEAGFRWGYLPSFLWFDICAYRKTDLSSFNLVQWSTEK